MQRSNRFIDPKPLAIPLQHTGDVASVTAAALVRVSTFDWPTMWGDYMILGAPSCRLLCLQAVMT